MLHLYYMHKDPKKCAELYTDDDVIRVPLSLIKVFTIFYSRRGEPNVFGYSCTLDEYLKRLADWMCNKPENYDYLKNLFKALMDEYTFRFQKEHPLAKYKDSFLPFTYRWPRSRMMGRNRLMEHRFPLQIPDIYNVDDNWKRSGRGISIVNSYRNYYKKVVAPNGMYTRRGEVDFDETPTRNTRV